MYAPMSTIINPLNTSPCIPGYLPNQSHEMAQIPGIVQMCIAEEDIVCYFLVFFFQSILTYGLNYGESPWLRKVTPGL